MSNPVQQAAKRLFDCGFFPFRLPPGEKKPPLPNYTGWKERPSDEQILRDIAETGAHCNLGISLPPGVVAIDIDSYDDEGAKPKTGGATITDLETELGPLPATTYSTRRGPQAITGPTRSAIYLYQLPQWAVPDPDAPPKLHDVGPDVETIHYGFRYMAAGPSVKDGMRYRWYAPSGIESVPPLVTTLPVLSDSWVDHLLTPEKSR
ncbi:hypothetical protein CH263_25670 [Rhodococcus sp. 06-1059B-a]|nr:bifunctional DNA primase/polymerase [Rhodococcus sp. 06-1059B-a]OZD57582.1 hypothetical protein CH263_25670 [Rhodococcus sp. 06-1059B-a]